MKGFTKDLSLHIQLLCWIVWEASKLEYYIQHELMNDQQLAPRISTINHQQSNECVAAAPQAGGCI